MPIIWDDVKKQQAAPVTGSGSKIVWDDQPKNAEPASQGLSLGVPKYRNGVPESGPMSNPNFFTELSPQRDKSDPLYNTWAGTADDIGKGLSYVNKVARVSSGSVPVLGPLGNKADAWTQSKFNGNSYDYELARQRMADEQAKKDLGWMAPVAELAGNVAGYAAFTPTALVEGAAKALPYGWQTIGKIAGMGASGVAIDGSDAAVRGENYGPLDAATSFGLAGGLDALKPIYHGAKYATGALYRGGKSLASKGYDATAREINSMVNGGGNVERDLIQAAKNSEKSRAINPESVLHHDELGKGDGMTVMDALGPAGYGLARDAGNASEHADVMLQNFHRDRLSGIGGDMSDAVKGIVPDYKPVGDITDDLKNVYDGEVNRRYKAAEDNPDSAHIWNEKLARIASTRHGWSGIQEAIKTSQDMALKAGDPIITPGFMRDPRSGRVSFDGMYDLEGNKVADEGLSLRFWDDTKKYLDAKSKTFGVDKYKANGLRDSAKAIRDSVDEVVPEYKNARDGASAFFGANDAIEAGAKHFNQTGNAVDRAAKQKAIDSMGSAEKELFRRSFMDEQIRHIEADPQRAVKTILKGDRADHLRDVLGDDAANTIINNAKVANRKYTAATSLKRSDTARALMKYGVPGSASGLGYGILTGDTDITHMGAAALAGMAGRKGLASLEKAQRQAWGAKMAKMLLSEDPSVIRAARLAAGVP